MLPVAADWARTIGALPSPGREIVMTAAMATAMLWRRCTPLPTHARGCIFTGLVRLFYRREGIESRADLQGFFVDCGERTQRSETHGAACPHIPASMRCRCGEPFVRRRVPTLRSVR